MTKNDLLALAVTLAVHEEPEPINWGVVQSVAVPIVVAALAALGYWLSHRAQKGDPEHKLIDQLRTTMTERDTFWQGQIAEVKATAKRAEEKAESAQEKAASSDNDKIILLYYSYDLRHHIDTGQGPPAPPWPGGLRTIQRGVIEGNPE